MPSPFTITPTPPTSLELKPGDRGRFSFTLKNLAAPDKVQDVMLRALLVGKDDKDNKAEEVDWVVAEPPTILNMSGGKIETVAITVRSKPGGPRGDHRVKLVVADKEDPNSVFAESSVVTFNVISPPQVEAHNSPRPSLPWWLVAVATAGLVLAIAGIVIAWQGRSNGRGTPSGAIAAFGGGRVPDGWLLCDGKPISRSQFASLYQAIGDAWGAGDGSTTFNLPDLRGFFLRGADDNGVRDPGAKQRRALVGGQPAAGVGSVQPAATAMPSKAFQIGKAGAHSHQAPTWTGVPGPYEVGSQASGYDYGAQAPPTTVAGEHDHVLSGGDNETRPINVAVNYIIKT